MTKYQKRKKNKEIKKTRWFIKTSSCSCSKYSSRTPNRKSKRMKKQSELDDGKVIYEYQRKGNISTS